jgi:hypothetical protein
MNNAKITIIADASQADALFSKFSITGQTQIDIPPVVTRRVYSALQAKLKAKAGYSKRRMDVLLDAISIYSISRPNSADSDMWIAEQMIDQGKSFEELVQYFLGN